MTSIYTLFVVLIVLAALLMIGIVLIQESKGGGLAADFASSNAIMGVRKTTDVIEKATWTLAAAMVVLQLPLLRACSRMLLQSSRRPTRTTSRASVPVRLSKQLLLPTMLSKLFLLRKLLPLHLQRNK